MNKGDAMKTIEKIIQNPANPFSEEDKEILHAGLQFIGADRNLAEPVLNLKIAMYKLQSTKELIASNERAAKSSEAVGKKLVYATWALVFASIALVFVSLMK